METVGKALREALDAVNLAVGRTEKESRAMAVKISLEPQVLFFDPALLERWRGGDRSYCSDSVCRRLDGSAGFGEYLVGSHFEELGYKWVFHDFDIFGTNRPGKYPNSEAVLLNYFGQERLSAIRSLHSVLLPLREPHHVTVETPDLLIFKPDGSEVRFAECKRTDTRDKLNHRQVIGLALIAAVLRCPADFFLVASRDSSPSLKPFEVVFPCLS
jgi:hypothetical protein